MLGIYTHVNNDWTQADYELADERPAFDNFGNK